MRYILPKIDIHVCSCLSYIIINITSLPPMTEDWKGATLQMLVFFLNADYAFQFIYGIAKLHDKTDVFIRGKANFCDSPRIYNFFFHWKFLEGSSIIKNVHTQSIRLRFVSFETLSWYTLYHSFVLVHFINFSLVNDLLKCTCKDYISIVPSLLNHHC